MTPSPRNPWPLALAALAAALAAWTLVPLFLKALVGEIDPWTANASRYFFSVTFWLPFLLRDLRRLPPPERRSLFLLALPPALAHMLCQISYGASPYFNSATMINFGARLSIPFATLFGFFWLAHERPLVHSPLFWTGSLVAGAGFFLFFSRGFSLEGVTSPFGMLLLLGYCIGWALYIVLVRRNLSPWPSHLGYAVVSVYVAAAMLLVWPVLGRPSCLLALSPKSWLVLILSAYIGLAWSHVLYYRAIRVIGPVASEASMLLLPFLTAVLAHRLFGESLLPSQWISGIFLLLGCSLILLARFRLHS